MISVLRTSIMGIQFIKPYRKKKSCMALYIEHENHEKLLRVSKAVQINFICEWGNF